MNEGESGRSRGVTVVSEILFLNSPQNRVISSRKVWTLRSLKIPRVWWLRSQRLSLKNHRGWSKKKIRVWCLKKSASEVWTPSTASWDNFWLRVVCKNRRMPSLHRVEADVVGIYLKTTGKPSKPRSDKPTSTNQPLLAQNRLVCNPANLPSISKPSRLSPALP